MLDMYHRYIVIDPKYSSARPSVCYDAYLPSVPLPASSDALFFASCRAAFSRSRVSIQSVDSLGKGPLEDVDQHERPCAQWHPDAVRGGVGVVACAYRGLERLYHRQ